MAVEPEFLKTACYFRKLEPGALANLGRFLFEKKLPAGEYVLWEGQKDPVLYFVITGRVRLFATSAEGREFIVRLVYGGDSFNDECAFDKDTNTFSAVTVSPVVLYGLRYENLAPILTEQPEVGAAMAEVFASRQRYFSKLAIEMVFRSATGRLARLLLERERLIRSGATEQKITQQDMAGMIGTVREIVGRSLEELEELGAIRLERNRIIIKDSGKLRELSGI